MPKGKGAIKQQQGGHSLAAPSTPETAAASPESPGDLTDSQELATMMERLILKDGAAIEEIREEICAQVKPIASMLKKHEQEIQGVGEKLKEVEGRTEASEAEMGSSSSQIQVLE
ncbi:hypothetical protein chiPu_0002171 [Chiloscyllium punctatum]|uniref:Uncharacterized protein n=1 Tax=Chiloscyllium punctatum TaxID=137246 RepID=A0A401S048_CHIPU|nr:hypothetical protein [Chiloscyllium punctatum]